jgi:hypothetical protein
MVMAKCSNCGADITSTGYDTEELRLPNEATGYLVSCKQCKTINWNCSREIMLREKQREENIDIANCD